MNISIKFLSYKKNATSTEVAELPLQKTVAELPLQKTVANKLESFIEKTLLVIGGLICLVGAVYLIDFVDKKEKPLYILAMISLPLFAFIIFMARSEKNAKPEEVISGELFFLADKIQIKNKESFSYSQITEIELIFNGVSEGVIPFTSTLLIRIKEDTYTFSIVIDSNFKRKQIIQVLSYLYEQKIPIKEWNKASEAIYLLKKIKEPETPKMLKIDENIQRLIDEIGENEP